MHKPLSMKKRLLALLLCTTCLFALAQRESRSCTVNWKKNEITAYSGDCDRHDLASGRGEAKGFIRFTGSGNKKSGQAGEVVFADSIPFTYKGNFAEGYPDGNGEYYLGDSLYFKGHFQLGLKEGKGELHYLRKSKPDSVIQGYWSGDEFQGDKYKTYNFTTTGLFDQVEIVPTPGSGNSVTIELSTTTGTPNGALDQVQRANSFVLKLTDIMSPTNSIVKRRSVFESANKTYYTYELLSFPCKIFGTLNTGDTFELEMIKSANWKCRIYLNR